jgi:anti-anti-sigma factor
MKARQDNNTLILIPEEDLVASSIEKMRDSLLDELKKYPDVKNVVLDATGIMVVDSLGVNLIIGLYRQTKAESKSFEIIGAGEKFMKVATFFRFPSLFNIKTEEVKE